MEQTRIETAQGARDLSARGLSADGSTSATVLLVEDEHFVREVTREILQAAGYSVLAFPSAADAKRVVGSDETAIQLLLTDVVLPDQNGLDLASDLISLCPQLKVVFISGYPENIVTRSGLARRGVSYLPKPYSSETLTETIREVLAGNCKQVNSGDGKTAHAAGSS
ncbi:MAG: response regulator [Acidobacteriota bacterium]|nr:response regulator [Acidobacteriota bacterium]